MRINEAGYTPLMAQARIAELEDSRQVLYRYIRGDATPDVAMSVALDDIDSEINQLQEYLVRVTGGRVNFRQRRAMLNPPRNQH